MATLTAGNLSAWFVDYLINCGVFVSRAVFPSLTVIDLWEVMLHKPLGCECIMSL